MSKSQRVSWADVNTLLDIQGESWHLRVRGLPWRERMLDRLCEFVGAQIAIVGLIANWRSGGPKDPIMPATVVRGFFNKEQEQAFARHVATRGWRYDPTSERLAASRERISTRVRRDLLADREWYANETLRLSRFDIDIDDVLYSALAPPRSNIAHIVTLHRAMHDRPFSDHERRLVETLHQHGHGLFEDDPLLKPALPGLSPRERETLVCLIRGDSAKQAARAIGVSTNTLNTYVKSLHKKFDVHSRGELLALFLSNGSNPPLSPKGQARAGKVRARSDAESASRIPRRT